MDEPLAKKRRIFKWNPECSRYNLRESGKGTGFDYCNICVIDLSVAGGGICKFKRHRQTKRHKEGVNVFSKIQSTLPSLLRKLESHCICTLQNQITTAELYFTTFVPEHNLPLSIGDHFTKLFKKCSRIVYSGGFSCGRRKTQAIVKYALTLARNERLIEACMSRPFSILCDRGMTRMYAINLQQWYDIGMKVNVVLSPNF